MPRKKIITDDELKKMIINYHMINPNIKIQISALTKYIQNNGYPLLKAYIIRRNNVATNLIKQLNDENNEEQIQLIATWKPLDINYFIQHNNNLCSLKNALSVRDQYYGKVCVAAGKIFKENNNLKNKINAQSKKIERLQQKIDEMEQKEETKISNDSKILLQKMKKILDDYLYPDIANEILKKEGLDELCTQFVNPDNVRENTIQPETNIQHSIVDDLMEGFNEK